VSTSRHALISNTAFPGIPYYGNPYVGDEIQQKITFQKNNVWSNNTYRGASYSWMPFNIGNQKTFAQWQAAPYNQDAGSTFDNTDPVTGLANTVWGPPAPPTGVTATAGNGQVRVSFNKTAVPGGAQVVGYTVTASPGGAQASGRGSPIDVTGLTNGTAYTFTVQTRNAMMLGSASSPSNSVAPSAGASYSTAKAPWYPRDVVPQLRGSLVEVSFFEPSDPGTSPVTSYTVTASPGGATTTAATSPATFAAPLPDGVYTFTATAASAAGTSPVSEPSEPFTLGAVAVGTLVPISGTRTASGIIATALHAKTATGSVTATRRAFS
jgi:hypothetical protein